MIKIAKVERYVYRYTSENEYKEESFLESFLGALSIIAIIYFMFIMSYCLGY